MDNLNFDWDDANILHLSEHGVTPEEAEEILLDDPIDLGLEVVDGEDRWSYVGETSEGRILRVVIALRGERMRVVTAFEPERHWKVFYIEQKAGLA
ncbi:MAG: BrnT family toxin [Terracidiphilus sp.]